MRVVVTYDVSDDKARRKVAEAFEAILTRVQLSVFEGDVPTGVLERFVKVALRHLEPGGDSIRVYYLCGACAPRTDIYGAGVAVREERVRVL